MSILIAVLVTLHVCGIPFFYIVGRVGNGITEFGHAMGIPGRTETRSQSLLKALVWELPLLGELASVAWEKINKLNNLNKL